jgi:hypothetical protein
VLTRRIEQEAVHLHPPVDPLVISGQHWGHAGSRKLVCNERCKGLSKSGSFCKPRSGRVPLELYEYNITAQVRRPRGPQVFR